MDHRAPCSVHGVAIRSARWWVRYAGGASGRQMRRFWTRFAVQNDETKQLQGSFAAARCACAQDDDEKVRSRSFDCAALIGGTASLRMTTSGEDADPLRG